MTKEQAQRDKALVKNELARIKEFGGLAENSMVSNQLIWEIEETYDLTEEETEGGFTDE
ncbi:MAG: hypothetical protein ACLTT1_03685 [[Clostridium] scindens]